MKYAPGEDMQAVANDLKVIYGSATLLEAEVALSTLFEYPEDIRKVIYTTYAMKWQNSVIPKAIRNRVIFSYFKT